MAWLSFLKKPAWQARDPAARAQAVAEGTEAELLDALPRLAAEDPDPGVRAAALSRIDDPVLLAERLRVESDASALALIRKRLGAALAGRLGSAELGVRLRVLGQCHAPELFELLAVEGREPELRRVALERIEKVGFLAERAMHDPDPELRLLLIERLPLGPALERVAEHARLRDKRVYRAAKARLEAAALERRTAEALVERARSLCQEAESIARSVPGDGRQRLARLDADWRALADDLPPELHTRFFGALQAADRALEAAERARRSPSSETATTSPETADGRTLDPTPTAARAADEAVRPHPQLSAWLAGIESEIDRADEATLGAYEQTWRELAQGITFGVAERELRAAFQRRVRGRRAELEEHRRSAERAHAAWVERLGAALQHLDDGRQAEARAAHAELRQDLDAVEPLLTANERKRWLKLNGEIGKLNSWLAWSNAKQRARLCDELEALIGRGLHPDALATAWKDAQQRWQELDRAEGLSAEESAALGISRRFRAIGHRLMRPAREFFDKRDEVRQQKRREVEGLLERAAAETESAAPAELVRLRRELVERLRRLDELDPRQRGALGRRLRETIDRIGTRLQAEQQNVAAAKRRYLAKLERELKYAEPEAALALAKRAQKEWPTLGRGARAEDEALTDALRRLIDPYFAQARAARAEHEAAQQERRAAAERILDRLERPPAELTCGARLLETIEEEWRALGAVEPDLERRYARARAQQYAALEARTHEQHRAHRQTLLAAIEFVDQLAERRAASEQLDRATEFARLEALCEGLPPTQRALLQANARAVLAPAEAEAGAGLTGTEQDAIRALIRAEFLAGIETPDAERQVRLDEQMQRLAARMAGVPAQAPGVEFDAVLATWIALPPALRTVDRRRRMRNALDAFRD